MIMAKRSSEFVRTVLLLPVPHFLHLPRSSYRWRIPVDGEAMKRYRAIGGAGVSSARDANVKSPWI